MTIFLILMTILQTFAISLGTGASTLAIINFFVAISDGVIDETERRMMGVVYVVLRIAMFAILLTSTVLIVNQFYTAGLVAFTLVQLLLVAILFTNALLMTVHLVPSTFGPAIQAGTWYSLGTLAGLQILDMTDFTFTQFILAYVTWIILAVGIVNGVMAILKARK